MADLFRTQAPQLTMSLIGSIKENLAKVQTQPVDDKILQTGEERFGPQAKKLFAISEYSFLLFIFLTLVRRRDNDPHLHTGQQIFSCECHSKNHEPGCLNFAGVAPIEAQPWHWTDGSVYLLRELADIEPALVESLLPSLAQAVRSSLFYSAAFILQCFAP